MYLHIGGGKYVRKKKVIGIFDFDSATVSGITRTFLKEKEKNGTCLSAEADIPKSFVLEEDGIITLSKFSSGVLFSRTGTVEDTTEN